MLKPQVGSDGQRNFYGAAQAIDDSLLTAWSPARGSREATLVFHFKSEVSLSEVFLFPGYGKDQAAYRKNNRVKDFALEFATGEKLTFRCTDEMKTQSFAFPSLIVSRSVTFRILSVYDSGSKFDDTPVAEIFFR